MKIKNFIFILNKLKKQNYKNKKLFQQIYIIIKTFIAKNEEK